MNEDIKNMLQVCGALVTVIIIASAMCFGIGIWAHSCDAATQLETCKLQAEGMKLEYDFTHEAGCRIKINDLLIPMDLVRLDDLVHTVRNAEKL
jgi:hypothetical protein